jgi:uncharacterized membrane protein
MKIGVLLLFAVGISFVFCMILLVSILLKNKTFNVQDVWRLVEEENKPAKTYFAAIVITFLMAVLSVFLMRLGV